MFADAYDFASPLTGEYTVGLVLLSIVVAVAASYVALDVAGRIWDTRGWMQAAWITAAGAAMGGGIWSMHFIGMLSFSLPMPIGYDIGLTLASLALAVLVTAIAFAIVAGDVGSRPRLLLAGTVMGLGVAVMHYTGMAAMRPSAVAHEPRLFALSIGIAVTASTAALWIATRVSGRLWQFGAAWVMGAAVCGMHYVAMDAACFSTESLRLEPATPAFAPKALALVIAFGTVVILMLEFVSALVDRRFSDFRLREAEIVRHGAERLQALIRSTNDLIVVLGRDGRIAFASPSAESAVGRPAEALTGMSLDDLLGDDAAAVQETLTGIEPKARADLARPVRLTLPDGGQRIFDVNASNLTDEPAVGGFVLTLHDVTARQQAADELRHAKELADAASRMKTQFISNMSHELRTPLNAIIGLSELIRMEIDGPVGSPRYLEYANDIRQSGHRLLDVINNVLDIGHLEANEVVLYPTPNDALALAVEAAGTIAEEADQKSITVTLDVSCEGMLRCDRRRMVQILANLLSNAVKFTGERGLVSVTGRASGDGFCFTVEDNGIGMPPEIRNGLFTPFFQADGSLTRRHEGSGLGLAISLGLARLHGGTIEIGARPEGGTRAVLTLPADSITTAEAA